MPKVSRMLASRCLAAGVCACLVASSLAQVSVRSVKVLGGKDTVEVEVEASDRIVPETQVLTGPDRLVVDFPNAVPSSQIRNQSIDRADVRDVRVGLFQAKPPITRVVLDLKSARSYQIFPYGRTVMIKISGASDGSVASNVNTEPQVPGLVATNYTTRVEPMTAPAPSPLQIWYHDGLLGIHANKVSLSEVLYAIQQRTGADISIPAGAEQEKVVADVPLAPAAEALAKLLNGSRFNFLILNSANDPRQLDRVILTARTEGVSVPPPPQTHEPEPDMTVEDPPVPGQPAQPPSPENAPSPPPEAPGNGDSPNQ